MRIIIRIYKWHDSEILSLKNFGISWPRFLKLALSNYADGKRIKYSLPDLAAQLPSAVRKNHSISSGSSARFSVEINDEKSLSIINKVKSGRRNEFCKAIMRDALICTPIEAFFADEESVSRALDVRQRPATITSLDLTDLCPLNSAKKKKKVKSKDKKTSSKRRKNKENMGASPSTSIQPSENNVNVQSQKPVAADRPPSSEPSIAPSAVRRPMEADFSMEAAETTDIPVFDMGEDFDAPMQTNASDKKDDDVYSLFSSMLSEVDNF